ncbi:tetratricopeptide repeat protein [Symbiobacterium terraclitae]|uniref:tetratricopeptide repeat protein n=1 Tax=Symbiobacterium terraclitae TaxID=557451 RepID=UPI0035B54CA8
MQPLFESCSAQLKARQYAACARQLSELARTAQTPDELLIAARVADLTLYPGLEMRLVRRAARTEPCPADVTLYLAATYLERGRYLETEELLTPWLESESWTRADRSRALGYLAVSYAARRRLRSAAAALERAAALADGAGPEAEQAVAFVRLNILAHEHRWEECAAGATAYMEVYGEEPRAYNLNAICLQHLGRSEEVIRTLEAACDRFPDHPRLLLHLSSAAWAVGQTDLAERVLDRVAPLLPGRRAGRTVRRIRSAMDEPGRRLPVPPLRQGHNHCFPACLAMIFAYYGRPADQRAVGSAIMDGSAGTPLYRALRYLEQEGWVARAFRATPDRVRMLVDRGVPPILGLEWAGGAHVHICVGYDDQWLYIQDPNSYQRRHLRVAAFDHVYAHSDYWALAFVPAASAGLLDVLPPDEDAAIRRMQACWEHLLAGRLDEARALYAEIQQGEMTVSRAFLRLRAWPRLGARAEALEAAEWVLTSFPDHRQIRLEVAQHLMRMDEEERAVTLVREQPGRQQAQALVILGLAARGESPAEACRLFRKAAIADPDNATPLQRWGQAEAQAGNMARAEALFQAAYEMDPSPVLAADLAHLRHRQGHPAEAVAAFRQVLRQERVYPWAWWMRGEAHWALGQHRAAARCLRIAIAQEPEGAHLVDRLADLYQETGQPGRALALLRSSPLLETSADLQYSLAVLLGSEGKWPEALAAAEHGARQFPEDLRFGPYLAEALRMTGRRDEGRALLIGLAAEHPTNAILQGRLGRFLLLEGEVEEGLRQLDLALQLDPDWKAPLDWAFLAGQQLDRPLPVLEYLTRRLLPGGEPWRQVELAKLWMEHDAARARELALTAWQHAAATAEDMAKAGEVLLLTDDPRGALAALRQALRRQRTYPWAWWRRSHAHWALGQRRAAVRALRVAAGQDPDSDYLLGELSDRYEALGQAERALALVRESRLTPRSADLQERLANLLLQQGLHAEALEAADSALQRFGEPGRFGPLAAMARTRLGREGEAAELLTHLCEQAEAAGDGPGLGALARAWLAHDAAQAIRWGRRALELGKQEAPDQLAFGHLLLEAGDLTGAADLLQQVVGTSPLPEAFDALAQIAEKQGDPEGQIAWLERAVDAALRPEEVRRYADRLADVLEAQGKPAEITAPMNRIEGRVNEAWRRTYLGYAAELTGEYAEAAVHHRAALELDPLSRWTHFRLPLALSALGQHDEAIRAAEAAVSRWPGDSGFHWVLGRCLLKAGRPHEAGLSFRTALELNPDAGPARRGLWEAVKADGLPALEAHLAGLPDTKRALALWWAGEWWREEGDQARAVAAWRAAALADPTDADPHIRLAQAAFADGDQEAAWRHAVEALVRRPGLFEFAHDLQRKSDPAIAAGALEAAVRRTGREHKAERADLLYLLGVCHELNGRTAQAVETWRWAVRDLPGQRGSVWRLAREYYERGSFGAVVELLEPLDEDGNLPADLDWLLVHYLRSAMACRRPRRPHWRRLVRERIESLLAEMGSDKPLLDRFARRGEIMFLGFLYARLEIEFGNRAAAAYGNVVDDRLVFALRLIAFRLRTALRRPALDVRPGESTEPAADGPIGGPQKPGPLRWMGRNFVITGALLACAAFVWPGLELAVPLAGWVATVLLFVFVHSLLL